MRPADFVDRDRLVKTFIELVKIDSPSGQEQAIGQELLRRLAALGCHADRDEAGNVIGKLPGAQPDTVLFGCHMDTAGTDTGITPVIREGVIYSDGKTILGSDDKSGIAGVLEMLRILRDHPDWSHPAIEAVFTVGEEQGLQGARRLNMEILKSKWGFVFDTGGRMGTITVAAPSCVYLTVDVHGKRAHAGVEPEKGISAIVVASEAVAAMPLGRIDEETVANIGTFRGGEARNIVPDRVTVQAMARSHDPAKLARQVAGMAGAFEAASSRRGARCDVRTEEAYYAYRITPDQKPYREAARAVQALGFSVTARKSGGGTDANFFNRHGIQCVPMSAGYAGEHTSEEHIAIQDLVDTARIMVTIATQVRGV